MQKPLIFAFQDDGLVPNNTLPFLIYKGVFAGDACDETALERLFKDNGWSQDIWRDGIFDYTHYHATVHEVLGVARGHARVRFGGDRGETLTLEPGDVAILPAGTGHRCLETSDDFSVVGAYPPGDTMQVTRPTPDDHRRALQTIPMVPRPQSDPVHGRNGALMQLWR